MAPSWGAKEIRELIEMVGQGKSLEQIAKHLKRSPKPYA
jgi:DNA-binding NarL/FixJ family response regulator